MGVKVFAMVVVGLLGFWVVTFLLSSVITGADTGSIILRNLLGVVVAALIVISVVMSVGKSE